jgi:hypothetical protein
VLCRHVGPPHGGARGRAQGVDVDATLSPGCDGDDDVGVPVSGSGETVAVAVMQARCLRPARSDDNEL